MNLEIYKDCSTCNGSGTIQVLTGEEAEGFQSMICPKCGGTGRILQPTLPTQKYDYTRHKNMSVINNNSCEDGIIPRFQHLSSELFETADRLADNLIGLEVRLNRLCGTHEETVNMHKNLKKVNANRINIDANLRDLLHNLTIIEVTLMEINRKVDIRGFDV